jgi:hypothetical protein
MALAYSPVLVVGHSASLWMGPVGAFAALGMQGGLEAKLGSLPSSVHASADFCLSSSPRMPVTLSYGLSPAKREVQK